MVNMGAVFRSESGRHHSTADRAKRALASTCVRQVRVILTMAVALATVLATGAGAATKHGGRFYAPPANMAKQAPGTIIRSTAIDAPAGAKAWKVLYHSRSVDGRDIAVSGVVVVPKGAAPKGGRPVVSWAHGTAGLGDQCAPSKAADVATHLPYVKQLVDAGDIVTATDYEGLGTPGVHPYLVGESEGRGVLDAARAARALMGSNASHRLLVFGVSQGGQAALFAGELAKSYAPELDVLGVAAAAPAADVEHIIPLAAAISGGAGYIAMGIQGFHAAYPDLDPHAILAPDAEARSEAATTQCAGAVAEAFKGVSGPAVFAHDPLSIPSIKARLHENSAGNRPAGAPLLLVQGTADTTIPKPLTDAFAAKACAAGDTVDYRTYDGATHSTVVTAAQDDVVRWLQSRVAGTPAPTTCS
jgi:pimeloyl-ACP methyl ester carboxylesterase